MNFLRDIRSLLKALAKALFEELKKERRLRKGIRAVRNSELFDAEWYLRHNPEVRTARMDPAYHYVVYGVKNGCNPSVFFINDEYYQLNADVKAAKVNPLVHYELHGRKEGRRISRFASRLKDETLGEYIELVRNSEFFDAEWYLRKNPDVWADKIDPAYHYVVYGVECGHNPSVFFDNDEYYRQNKDAKARKMNPLVHYELLGRKEGRRISCDVRQVKDVPPDRYVELVRKSEFFDSEWYLRHNPDVRVWKIDPAYHYVAFGVELGRNPSAFFDNDSYHYHPIAA